MEVINTFEKGLNSDISKLSTPNGNYLDAKNIDIILDESNSSLVITNSKGNKLQSGFPGIGQIHSWSLKPFVENVTIKTTIGIGTIIDTWTSNEATTNSDLAEFIKETWAVYIANGNISVYSNASNVVIVENDPIYVSLGNNTAIDRNFDREIIFSIPSDSHFPIGYTTINSDIYIITTTGTSPTGGGYGFIWKYTYNSQTFDPSSTSMELIYGAPLNMSTYFNIPPTAIVGRYETEAIQKIWFTDFFNPLRFINVADPEVMAEHPSLLSITPEITMYKPILSDVNDGGSVIDTGVYQLTYRMTKTNGVSTVYSPFSNIVSLGLTPLSSGYQDYVGGPGTTNKTIAWNLTNLDVDFDFVEIVVIKRTEDSVNSVAVATLTHTLAINNRGSLSITIDGDSITNGLDIDLSELLDIANSHFTHCKTIAEKDNLLIASNLKNVNTNLNLSYDARAYRAQNPNSVTIPLIRNGVSSLYALSDLTQISKNPKENDNINDYTDDSTESLYKPNSDIPGGSGTNISYEFTTTAIQIDNAPAVVSPYSPYVSTDRSNNVARLEVDSPTNPQEYSLGGDYQGFSNPQTGGLLKGYRRGEIYRFGIQFYTKEHIPLFVEWIGDIKFPEAWEKNTNAYYEDWAVTGGKAFTGLDDFKTSSIKDGKLYGHSLGIEFTVKNIPSNISGYSIVRLERKDSDRRILFQGFSDGGYEDFGRKEYFWGRDQGGNIVTTFTVANRGFLKTPGINTGSRTLSSQHKLVHKYTSFISANGTSVSTNSITRSFKYNNLSIINSNTKSDLLDVISVSGEEHHTSSKDSKGDTIINRCFDFKTDRFTSYGNPAYYYRLNNVGPNVPPVLPSRFSVYIINAVTDVPNQYGGVTHNDRSSSEYISCGHFRPSPIAASARVSETSQIFGGDTYVSPYDSMTQRKDFADPGKRLEYAQVGIVPLEVDINIGLMGSTKANKDHTQAANDASLDIKENNNYLFVYSAEDNLRKFYPKPSNLEEIDEWVNRHAASETKINGESNESWADFKIADVWDVDGVHGPINSIKTFGSRLYYWQDKAFGVMHVNPRAVVGDISNPDITEQIQLGLGNKLQRHDNLSTTAGTQHQGSVINSASALYWFDINTKKIYKYTTGDKGGINSISDLKGLYSFLNKNVSDELLDKPVWEINGSTSGITTAYDHRSHNVYFTIHNNGSDTPFTIAYNELMKSFVSFYSFTPTMLMNDSKNVFSFDPDKVLYVHNRGDYGNYYGQVYESSLKFMVNQNPRVIKTFDNISMETTSIDPNEINQRRDTWNKLRVTTSHQNTDFIDLVYDQNIKRVERDWRLAIPRNRVLYTNSDSPDIYTDISPTKKKFGERMRDHSAQVELVYENKDNNLLLTNYIGTTVRESKR